MYIGLFWCPQAHGLTLILIWTSTFQDPYETWKKETKFRSGSSQKDIHTRQILNSAKCSYSFSDQACTMLVSMIQLSLLPVNARDRIPFLLSYLELNLRLKVILNLERGLKKVQFVISFNMIEYWTLSFIYMVSIFQLKSHAPNLTRRHCLTIH